MSFNLNSNVYLPGVIEIPSSMDIVAITRAYPMVATITVQPVTESNSYIAGQLVRFTIPITYGMFQLNGLVGKILSVAGSNLTVDIDTRNFDPFIVPISPVGTPASLAPSGSRNKQYDNTTNLLAFQALNNRGN